MGSAVPTIIVDVVGLVPRVWVMVRDGSIGFLDSPSSFKKRFMIVRIAVCGVLCAQGECEKARICTVKAVPVIRLTNTECIVFFFLYKGTFMRRCFDERKQHYYF